VSYRLSDNEINVPSNRQPGYFVHLFVRKAKIIVPVFLITILIWFAFILHSGLSKPKLTATAVLQFDDPVNLSAVERNVGIPIQPDTKVFLLKSRSFLEVVAKKMHLQLQVKKYARTEIFDSVNISLDALTGNYLCKIDKNSFHLFYKEKNADSSKNVLIKKGSIDSLSTFEYKGLYLSFTEKYVKHPYTFSFSVTRLRDAVDFILNNLTVRSSGDDDKIMSVSISGRDYELIAQIANMIADNFSDENSSTKMTRQSGVLNTLEKQLERARLEMEQSEKALKKFRNENPTIGLQDAFAPPVKIDELVETEAELRSARLEGLSIKKRYATSEDTNRISIINEMISFMTKYEAATASAFQTELNQLADDYRTYKDQYSPLHPVVRKNLQDIQLMGVKVAAALNDLLGTLQRKINENSERITSTNRQIARLPSKQLELANLQRKYDVNSEVYTNVLTRYNEAKIAHAVAIGDVYVVDHAIAPEEGFDIKSMIMLAGLGIFFSLLVSFGPVSASAYLDKTAKTDLDLKRKTNILLLESIPVKKSWNKNDVSFSTTEVYPKLLPPDIAHNYVDETYRSLRAKILLNLHDEKSKRIIVTSMNVHEGKSFTCANLGITMAQQNISTLLIDGDLRRGKLHLYFARKQSPGLSDLLLPNVSFADLQKCIQSTHVPNLSLLTSGELLPNSVELLNFDKFTKLINLLSELYELIILDTPPLAIVSDAIGLQNLFQKYIIVVRASHTNIESLNEKIREFPDLESKILGIVLNGAPLKKNEYYQYTNYRSE
jgi:capsular exopolysaccharide synthesis family protein